jgi:hypothetical protein
MPALEIAQTPEAEPANSVGRLNDPVGWLCGRVSPDNDQPNEKGIATVKPMTMTQAQTTDRKAGR